MDGRRYHIDTVGYGMVCALCRIGIRNAIGNNGNDEFDRKILAKLAELELEKAEQTMTVAFDTSFDHYWPYLAMVSLPVFAVWLPYNHRRLQQQEGRPAALLTLGIALTPLYMIHQFEEHAIDCLGRRYSFIDYFNAIAPAKFGALLDARTITLINVPLTWLITPLFAIMAHGKGRFDAVPIYLMWGLAFFNATFAPIMPAVLMRSYNPGLRAIGHAIFAVWLLTGLMAVPVLISTVLQCVVRGGARGEKKAA
ncbi:unnamed protein product [Vitrella brassicaformis CCMP3155]|uniref:Uncharacterized protein n=1 Tax=Vitrella brassicaformis (strain CCMP3155) TaxID=1169540 RepID=A0A0G4EXW4_VITBC|nr:unnamed protein product [Vitrella brassicaformis CCMP3155]|eukprot:CEM03245.1 unnamed protein product [Vitrella brassicaformis CCMP3155]